ncbi:MAG: DNA polymerase III subunit delta [Xanthobacteraceae bacterium]|nr:MAG: DNA polymerase III subunit delta [Xanthobacteraceae bacterium]
MVALPNRDIDAFLASPDPARPVILLFGPDTGLVAERASLLVRGAVENADDPFAVTRLDGDVLANDSDRLVDEALTVPLFGGRRAIHVKAGASTVIKAVDALLAVSLKDCRVVIEAGELRREAPLRKAVERAKNAVAIACYLDSGRDLARLIDQELRESNLRIAPDARAALMTLIGGDRLASRNELRKLALYAAGGREVTLDDVRAIITDASALGLDPIADNAFAGHHAELEHALTKAYAAGIAPAAVMSVAQRLAALLHKTRLAMAAGESADEAKRRTFPKLHFSRAAAIDAALRAWSVERLGQAMAQLAEASLEVRRRPLLAHAIAQRTLLALSASARRAPAR